MINLKDRYKKIKDILILVLLDLAALVLSTVLSVLIVNMKIEFTLDLLFWFLINIAVMYVLFAVFRMYQIVFTSVGIIDTLRALCAT